MAGFSAESVLGATVFKLEECCGHVVFGSQQGVSGNIYLSEANAFPESGWLDGMTWKKHLRLRVKTQKTAALHYRLAGLPAQCDVAESQLMEFFLIFFFRSLKKFFFSITVCIQYYISVRYTA